jgi:hypothetical protein
MTHRSDRIFRGLLRLFPADVRGDFGDDMAATFIEHGATSFAHNRVAGTNSVMR